MNIERLQAVRNYILKHPEKLGMRDLHCRRGLRSTHCIFGIAQILYSPRRVDRIFGGWFASWMFSTSDVMNLLDIDYSNGCELYYFSQWPIRLRKQYELGEEIKSPAIRALAAAEAINEYIAKHSYLRPVDAA